MFINNFSTPDTVKGITIHNVSPVRGGDSFLFVCNDVTFLYDTGFGYCSEVLYENVRKVLGERPLDYILLTHSHYDHAMGSAYLSVMYPNVKVVAFSYAAKILEKTSARIVMRSLNKKAAEMHGITEFNDYVDHLHADITVEDNEIIMLESHAVRVISLPGHTKDCVAYYLEDEKIMLGTETLGMYVADGLVMPSFLVGYQMSLESIAKIQEYDIESYFIPHWGLISGEDVQTFFDDSYKGHVLGHDTIVDNYKAGKGHEEIFGLFQDLYYTPLVQEVYPFAAFKVNTDIQIPMVLREEGLME